MRVGRVGEDPCEDVRVGVGAASQNASFSTHVTRSTELSTGYHFFDSRQYAIGFLHKRLACLTD